MAFRTPPFKHYAPWSTARFWGFIRSALRQCFSRYPVKYQVIKDAAIEYDAGFYKTGKKAGEPKVRKMYPCAICKEEFMGKDIQVDHIIGAGSLRDYGDLEGFVERLFCGPDGLQVLCKPCHVIKTKEDKEKL